MIYFLKTFFCLCLAVSALGAEEPDRPVSRFKIGLGDDDWLALPEVFSNLDFTADSTPASEEDVQGQMRLRSTRFWGRLYLDGWPQPIQYFRAHFGIDAPFGKKHFVFAEPRDGCDAYTNSHLITPEHIVFVNRGKCTYGTKAKLAQAANASAIIIINNEPGIEHLPGPDAHDIEFSIGSISQQEGNLLETFYDEGPGERGFAGRYISGYMTPINCENSGAKCVPATYAERGFIKNLVDGGLVHVHNGKVDAGIEYLIAHFGTKVAHLDSKFGVAMAKPPQACTAIQKEAKGKVVLVRRGGCPFVQKAEMVQAAGGIAMIVGSLNSNILRMGVEPRWKGLNTAIPVAMVSKRAYSILLAESYGSNMISFEENPAVNSTTWEYIEKLNSGQGWPRSAAYIKKKYEELQTEYQGWPDRMEALNEAYAVAMEKGDKTSTNVKSDL